MTTLTIIPRKGKPRTIACQDGEARYWANRIRHLMGGRREVKVIYPEEENTVRPFGQVGLQFARAGEAVPV